MGIQQWIFDVRIHQSNIYYLLQLYIFLNWKLLEVYGIINRMTRLLMMKNLVFFVCIFYLQFSMVFLKSVPESNNKKMVAKKHRMAPTICKVTQGYWKNKTVIYEKPCDWAPGLFECQQWRKPWRNEKQINSIQMDMDYDNNSDFLKAIKQFEQEGCKKNKNSLKMKSCPHHHYSISMCLPQKCTEDSECKSELGSSCIFGRCVV